MKVFIWNSYGETAVYAFETKDQQDGLKRSLVAVLQRQGYEVDMNSPWKLIYDSIEDERVNKSEFFEYGTGTNALIYETV